MNCLEVQELLGSYWDLPQGDANRIKVERHIEYCASCAQQFKIWEESQQLILSFSEDTVPIASGDVSDNVMKRIYEESSWFAPVSHRTYAFSAKLRRNIAALVACFMAVFLCSFMYLAVTGGIGPKHNELIPTAVASEMNFTTDFNLGEIPVASIGDPPILKVVPTYPQYWIALSLLGVAFTLLMLNWLARVRH